MTVGIGQILIIIIVIILLFGKFPNLSKDFLAGITSVRNLIREKKESESSEDNKLITDRRNDKHPN